MSTAPPLISVVVTTLGRPDTLACTVESILANHHDRFELLLVDQNADDLSSRGLGSLLADTRLRYIRSENCGASKARNMATSQARGQLILYTDDDCVADRRWIEEMERAFESEPKPDVVLGRVTACVHDTVAGFVPACSRAVRRTTTSLKDQPLIEVMGACMGIRRSAWTALDGFAEWMGPGTSNPAGEDYDLVLRGLLTGHSVLEVSEPVVIHHGFRTWAEGFPLVDAYTRGTALVVGLRLAPHPLILIRCLSKFLGSFLFSRSEIIASARIANRRGRRLLAFSEGLVAGLRVAVVR